MHKVVFDSSSGDSRTFILRYYDSTVDTALFDVGIIFWALLQDGTIEMALLHEDAADFMALFDKVTIEETLFGGGAD